MNTFEGLGLNPALSISLAAMKYTTPTPIQAQAIPLALEGRDIMGTAQTGTGKTAAYAIPLVEMLLRNEAGGAIVLTPTRELGKQVMDIIRQLLGPKSGIRSAFLIGGESMHKQRAALKNHPRLIVGTPGRINDHLRSRTLNLKETRFLVLDETDRMLDMGFSVQIDDILKHMPAQRQTLMFSATLPQNILRLSGEYLNNPARVAVGSTDAPIKNIKQEIIHVEDTGKYDELVKQLNERNGSVIIFVKTKHGTERLAKKLSRDGHQTDAIHGDLKQSRRGRVISDFRDMKFRILCATDVAARGLDIPHIEHVINYDLPQVAEDYIHRIGRTARAGAEGASLCLISGADKRKWRMIEELINPNQRSSERSSSERSHGTANKKPHRGRSFGGGGGNRDRKFGGGDRDRKFSSDRKPKFAGERKFADRPQRAAAEDRFEKPAGDRFQKFDGEKSQKPFGDRKPKFGGDRAPRKFEGERKFSGERPARKFDGERKFSGERPARKFDGEQHPQRAEGNRPPRKFDGERTQRPDGDRPPRKFDGERKFTGARKPTGDGNKKFSGERKFNGDRKPKFGGDRPHKAGGAKKRHTIGDLKRRSAA